MAYFQDLQPCTAFPGEWNNLLAVGFLEKREDFTQGPLDRELINALGRINSWQPEGAPAALHRCPLCPVEDVVRARDRAIFIPGEGVLYVAPWSILHSLRKHGYAPPPAFAQAAMKAVQLSARAFHEAIGRHLEGHADPYDASNIVVLEGLEPVRIRPGMYVGGTDSAALGHMLFEVVANSFDEYLARHATRISVEVDDEGWVSVEDDGRGIPVEKIPRLDLSALEVIFTRLHAGATLDGHHPHVHIAAKLRGVGVSVVNALSSRLEVESRREGVAYRAAFERGQPVLPLERLGATEKRGTHIRYLHDEQIFGVGTRLEHERVESRLKELARLAPTLDLRFQGLSLQFPEGLAGWLRELAPEMVKETALLAIGTVKGVEVEVAFGWRPRASSQLIRSFVNYAETVENGSHVSGLVAALEHVVGQKRASRKKKVLAGLVGVVHVGMLEPRFGGPIKAHLEVDEARAAVREVVLRAINEAPWWWKKLNNAIG